MILLATGFSLKSYREDPRQILAVTPSCPDCGRPLNRHGSYWRWVYLLGDESFQIVIFRFFCRSCGLTVSLLPDFLVPYYRYVAAVIGAALSAFAVDAASLRTTAASLTGDVRHDPAGPLFLVPSLPSIPTLQAWRRRFFAWSQTYLAALVRWTLRLTPASPVLHLLADPPGVAPQQSPARRDGATLIRVARWLAQDADAWLPYINRFVRGVMGRLPWQRPPPAAT